MSRQQQVQRKPSERTEHEPPAPTPQEDASAQQRHDETDRLNKESDDIIKRIDKILSGLAETAIAA